MLMGCHVQSDKDDKNIIPPVNEFAEWTITDKGSFKTQLADDIYGSYFTEYKYPISAQWTIIHFRLLSNELFMSFKGGAVGRYTMENFQVKIGTERFGIGYLDITRYDSAGIDGIFNITLDENNSNFKGSFSVKREDNDTLIVFE